MKYDGINPINLLHTGEPFFLIRAQDTLAAPAIMAYEKLLREAGDEEEAKEIHDIADAVWNWQLENKDKVKMPDPIQTKESLPTRKQEEILKEIRYRAPDQIPNPETYSIQTLIDGDKYEKIPVQFEFRYVVPLDWKDEKIENPLWASCEYEPFFNAGEIVIRPRIRPAD